MKQYGDCPNPFYLGERGNVAKSMFCQLTSKIGRRKAVHFQRATSGDSNCGWGLAAEMNRACTDWLNNRYGKGFCVLTRSAFSTSRIAE